MILHAPHAASLLILTILVTVLENRCLDIGLLPLPPPAKMHGGNLWVLSTFTRIPGAKISLAG